MNNKDKNEIWISLSDIMTALMVIFLFICISYMNVIKNEKEEIKEVALTWQMSQEDIYNSLHNEFKNDLEKWKAVIDKDTLTIRFTEPKVLFKAGEHYLTEEFENILINFLPRYQKILNQYNDEIQNIRIEGHTSSDWGDLSKIESYKKNMKLSQERTQSVLDFWLTNINTDKKWIIKYVEAVGKSFSDPILNLNNNEDKLKSRRVEFKVKTKTEQKIMKILGK